ncbi:MAG: glycosyltransferase family 4 protein [Cyanophyceae cyanobacterium]
MKILFLITRADTVGGAQVHVRDLARYLCQAGHQVQVITGARGPYSDALSQHNVPNSPCPTLQKPIKPIQDWQTLNQLVAVMRHSQPDLVCTHSSKAGIIGRIACRVTNTPCVFTAHGWAFTEGVPEPQRTIYRRLEQLVAPLASRVICVSERDRQIGIAAGMNPAKLVTIHNGMADIPHQDRATPDTPSVTIVMVARFDRQKDHLTLLKAVQPLPNVKLQLIGDGPNLAAVQALVESWRLSDRVELLGYRPDVAQLLAHAQIFALISHWEGFPYTIVEAMRAGLPVVASDIGGVAEAVVDGVTGYCVPCGDVETLRNRLARLIDEPRLRRQLGDAGRHKYETEFTFQQMFGKTYQLYEQVVNQDGSLARR